MLGRSYPSLNSHRQFMAPGQGTPFLQWCSHLLVAQALVKYPLLQTTLSSMSHKKRKACKWEGDCWKGEKTRKDDESKCDQNTLSTCMKLSETVFKSFPRLTQKGSQYYILSKPQLSLPAPSVWELKPGGLPPFSTSHY